MSGFNIGDIWFANGFVGIILKLDNRFDDCPLGYVYEGSVNRWKINSCVSYRTWAKFGLFEKF